MAQSSYLPEPNRAVQLLPESISRQIDSQFFQAVPLPLAAVPLPLAAFPLPFEAVPLSLEAVSDYLYSHLEVELIAPPIFLRSRPLGNRQ
jgi:hypothetical protein